MSLLFTLAMASGLWPLAALADLNSDVSNSQLQFNADAVVIARINPVTRPGPNMLTCGAMAIAGPNNINSASTSDSLRQGICTTAQLGGPTVDMSAFGTSELYHVNSNGSFSAIHINQMSVTYTLYGNDVEPFPDNFAMSLGDARGFDVNCGQNGKTLPWNGYFISDHGNANNINQQTSGQMGLLMQFPDCWNGQPFGPNNQSQAMTFHLNSDGYPCPSGFSHKLMGVQIITYWHTDGLAVNPNGATFVLGSGDHYGCTAQGFYIPAFQSGVQQAMISECNNIGHGNTAFCPPLKIGTASTSIAQSCRYTEQIPQEDIGAAMPVSPLPGCNMIGSRPHKCNPRVDYASPAAFDTHLRGQAGLPVWPAHGATNHTAGTPATMSEISTHSLYITEKQNWGGNWAMLWVNYGTCYSLAQPVNNFNFFRNFNSATADDSTTCTLYRYDDCSDTSLTLPKGGVTNFGNQGSIFGGFKCSAR